MEPTEVAARADGLTLAGSLWLPDEPPRAAVVMHPGSGPSDRHNDDLFPEVRPLFLAARLAVASFDKRGVGRSEGDWRDAAIGTPTSRTTCSCWTGAPGSPPG